MYNIGSKILAHLNKIDNLVNDKYQFPISCEIDPSNFCQNNCNWCIYANYIKGERCHLDFDLYLQILRQLKENGCKSITFTGGGEPLMNPSIKQMITLAHFYGFKLGLITNGILLDKIMKEVKLFDFIRVSIDAIDGAGYFANKGYSAFHKVCENVKAVADLKVTDIGISMVYDKESIKEARQFHKLGEKLGTTYSQVKQIISEDLETYSVGESDAFVTDRYLVKNQLPCKIAGLIGQIAANGKFYYCCIHRGNEKYMIGDLANENLVDIIEKRSDFVPDLRDCISCRYMNYAKEYMKVKDDKWRVLRHINFL